MHFSCSQNCLRRILKVDQLTRNDVGQCCDQWMKAGVEQGYGKQFEGSVRNKNLTWWCLEEGMIDAQR
ncbi:hypothetical protein C5167_003696 [Papaver somniferum]|uniref:Uncharacterized protein n=1 Tax=Papaver somniferum TaxID=3469 RepID=A0A4Y7L5D0_PAPSO|nr:hypothetical protein C5167_003696 [Papaver somniferum]